MKRVHEDQVNHSSIMHQAQALCVHIVEKVEERQVSIKRVSSGVKRAQSLELVASKVAVPNQNQLMRKSASLWIRSESHTRLTCFGGKLTNTWALG
jgi:hypothetical protein